MLEHLIYRNSHEFDIFISYLLPFITGKGDCVNGLIIADDTVLVSEDAGHHPHALPDVEDTI